MTIRSQVLSCLVLLALGACGGGGGALGDSPTLTGQIQNWTQGTGYTLQANVGGNVAAMAPVDQSGKFSITLPGAAVVTPWLAASNFTPANGCTGQVNVSPTTLKSATPSFIAVKGTDTPINVGLGGGSINLGGPVDVTNVLFTYVDQDASATGEIKCTGSGGGPSSDTTYSVSVARGWNTVVTHETGMAVPGGMLSISIANGGIPSGVQWQTGLRF